MYVYIYICFPISYPEFHRFSFAIVKLLRFQHVFFFWIEDPIQVSLDWSPFISEANA